VFSKQNILTALLRRFGKRHPPEPEAEPTLPSEPSAPPVLRCKVDNLVRIDDHRFKVVEAMSSGKHALSTDLAEVIARIHPAKWQLFQEIAAGQVATAATIEFKLKQRDGNITTLAWDQLANATASTVRGAVQAKGFDVSAEPVLRQMNDGSFRVVFCSMPPAHHPLGREFDVDKFGQALCQLAPDKILWDDRDVFIIERATEPEVRAVLNFLKTYGQATAPLAEV
jgi:hypothetical protein